ncbi:MAG TPA: YceI family protein [Longimicrobiales bacterium]|nr:YceI family protein [Longimicrobiales bacterium]
MRNLLNIATVIVAAAALVAATPATTPEPWNVDAAHTEVTFEVRHFFTPVSGRFDDFDIELVYDAEDVSNSSVRAVIPVASIDTNNERRDEHLESPDFFDAPAYPNITFESTSIRRVTDNELIATGQLTIRDVTREVELPITMLGVKEIPAEMQEMLGGVGRVAAFQATLEIDRNDFGVGSGQWATDAVVGKNVSIRLAVEANQPAEL